MILYLVFFQVPGRLGLLVTLYLIMCNVYNSVKAPSKRGYIEIWMVGAQLPIVLAILEYGILLAWQKNNKGCCEANKYLKAADDWSFIFSALFITFFNLVFWLSALT